MDKNKLRDIIRHNITELRTTKGFTQENIGIITDKSKNAVSSWEQGLSLPDITTLYKLSKLYNVSLEYFYEDHHDNSGTSENESQAKFKMIILDESGDIIQIVDLITRGESNEQQA